jgi:hypothetical protein
MRHKLNIQLDSELKKLITTYGIGQIVNAAANACFEIAQDERKPNTKHAHLVADAWQMHGSKLARTLLV